MTKAVFIAAAEPYSGKSLVALGLVNLLLGQARRVGYFKPIINDEPAGQPDPHISTITSYFKLALPYADTYAYTRPEALRLLETEAQGELIDTVIHKFKRGEEQHDFTVVEGSFGVYAADKTQKIQLCLLSDCADPGSTRNAVTRYFEWLGRSGELPMLVERAAARRRIIDAVLAEA